jgi:hypothetical protein
MLIDEFICQRISNKNIVTETGKKFENKGKRGYAEITQEKPYPNHIKIFLALVLTLCFFIIYLGMVIVIMSNMEFTARIAVFEIDSCKSRSELDLLFRSLFYEFNENDDHPFELPTEAEYNIMIKNAQGYPRFFTDKTNSLDFYFGSREQEFKNILNGDFCKNHVALQTTLSQRFARYVCENFSGQTAKIGMLGFWYYEIETLRSIYLDILGKNFGTKK